MNKKTNKKAKKLSTWRTFPQKDWQQWFAEFVMSQLALKFYEQNKKWPRKIKLETLEVTDNTDGSANLTVDLA